MNPSVLDLKEKADKELKEKQYKEAILTYTCALRWPGIEWSDFPHFLVDTLCKRAECYYELEEFSKAIEDSTLAIQLHKPHLSDEEVAAVLYLQVKSLMALNFLVEALVPSAWLSHLKPKNKEIQETMQQLRERLLVLFEQDEAVQARALLILIDFGCTLFSMANTEIAFHVFTETLNLFDFTFIPPALIGRAECSLKMGQVNDAFRDCSEVLRRFPDNEVALKLMREIQICIKEKDQPQRMKPNQAAPQTSRPEESQRETSDNLQDVVRLQFLPEAKRMRKNKQYKEAVEMYTVIFELSSMYGMLLPQQLADVLCKRAECHIRLGQFAEAAYDSQLAINLGIENEDGHLGVSLYLHMKALEGQDNLIDAYRVAICLSCVKPKDEKVVTAKQQLKTKLLDLFKQVVGSRNRAKEHLLQSGVATFIMRNIELASAIFTETINLFDGQFIPSAFICRARCYLEMGQLEDALKDCSEVLCNKSCCMEEVFQLKLETLELKKKIEQLMEEKQMKREKLPFASDQSNIAELEATEESAMLRNVDVNEMQVEMPKVLEIEEDGERTRSITSVPEKDTEIEEESGTETTKKESTREEKEIKESEDRSILNAAMVKEHIQLLQPNYDDIQASNFTALLTDRFEATSEMANYELEESEATEESAMLQNIDVNEMQVEMPKVLEIEEDGEWTRGITSVPEKDNEIEEEAGTETTKKPQATKTKKKKKKKKNQDSRHNTEIEEVATEKQDELEEHQDLQQKQEYLKCVEILDDNEVDTHTTKNSKKKKKKKRARQQEGDRTTPITGDSLLSETSYQGTLSAASSVSNLPVPSVRETSAASNAWRSKKDLGVYIVCKHVIQENQKIPACKDCENRSDLLYAFWCRKKNQWQVLRPYPKGVWGPFQQCKHYLVNNPCGRIPCTFAHGAEEIKIWNIQREQGDTRSRPASTNDTFMEHSSIKSFGIDKTDLTSPDENSASVTNQQEINDPTSRSSLNSYCFPTLSARSQHAASEAVDASTQSAWDSGAPKIQPQQASQPNAPKGATVLRNEHQPINCAMKPPHGVYCVCEHFLDKHFTRHASVYEKRKVCKGCENRSKLHYAFWCEIKKTWRLPRTPPGQVKGAFQLCKHFMVNKTCLKEPCTFAHGQEELLIWAMQRKGALKAPGECMKKVHAGKSVGQLTMKHLQYNHRPPPDVFGIAYEMCKWVRYARVCRYGRGCLFAHGMDELNAWKEEYEKEKSKTSGDQNPEEETAANYVEEITRGPECELVDSMDGVTVECKPPNLNVTLTNDGDRHTYQWKFCLTYKLEDIGHLRHVLLLHRYHHCYKLKEIRVGHYEDKQSFEMYILDFTAKLDGLSYKAPPYNIGGRAKIDLTVSFAAPVFGTFAQCVLFVFGRKQPYLVQRLNVDVCSYKVSDKLMAARHDVRQQHHIWDENSMDVVRSVASASTSVPQDNLLEQYSLPKRLENIVSAQVTGEALKDHYKRIMHQLLFVEETSMRQQISRYYLHVTSLHAQRSIFDECMGVRWAAEGELYGTIDMLHPITPDDATGRLFIRNVCAVWLKPADTDGTPNKRVYEVQVEKVENDCVVLKLTSGICSDLQLYDTCDAQVEAQFQLNREPLCRMHAAVDNLGPEQLELLFPDPATFQNTRPALEMRWNWLRDSNLSDQQKKVITSIVSPASHSTPSPPLVVFGSFGTGKTFTLSHAVRQLVQDQSTRILLCTHSNKAADIHVQLLDDYLVGGNGIQAAKPLRVYEPLRKFEATSEKARKYCLLNNGEFVLPSRQDVIRHQIVITTLATSRVLLHLQLDHGIFTHILVDEAAQALEPEAVIPLALAGPNTKIVLTGDHMQIGPDVFSRHANDCGLQRSLPERLFDHYEATQDEVFMNANVMFLRENYRSHEEILNFPSDNFYGGKLIARGHANQPAHPSLGPLVFYTARGKEVKDQDNSFMNLAEVAEVVKRVEELAGDWPTDKWGTMDLSEIAVLAAYRFQVQAIRTQFRKRNMIFRDVTVDTIYNVQGQQFRAIFISTVRTVHTCKNTSESVPEPAETRYLEFLSDPKLLNTATTRARSLVAIVGDPVSLCTVGHCRGLWRDYIGRCNDGIALHGTTMHELEKDIIESVKGIPLNPDAITFTSKNAEIREQQQATEESSAKIDEAPEQQNPQLERCKENKCSAITIEAKESKETDDVPEMGSESSRYHEDSYENLN